MYIREREAQEGGVYIYICIHIYTYISMYIREEEVQEGGCVCVYICIREGYVCVYIDRCMIDVWQRPPQQCITIILQ